MQGMNASVLRLSTFARHSSVVSARMRHYGMMVVRSVWTAQLCTSCHLVGVLCEATPRIRSATRMALSLATDLIHSSMLSGTVWITSLRLFDREIGS